MVADDARPTGTLTHLPSDSGTAFGTSRSHDASYVYDYVLTAVVTCSMQRLPRNTHNTSTEER